MIFGAISKPNLTATQIGLITALTSVWNNMYNLMVFQGGKLHLFYTYGSYAGQNDTARYLMDGTREYVISNIAEGYRAYQWSTDGNLIYGNNYSNTSIYGISVQTYLPTFNHQSNMQRECFCNPFDKKISVMNHSNDMKVLDIATNVLTSYSVGTTPFANYMLFRCENGLTWWIDSSWTKICCYDEIANVSYYCTATIGLGKVGSCPYHNGLYCISASDKGLCHYWLENGVIHFEKNLHTKLGLSDLGSGFGTGKSWGIQIDPEERNSLILVALATGQIYRVANLPKNAS